MNIFGIFLDHILKDEPDKEELKAFSKLVFSDKLTDKEEVADNE